MHLPNLSMLLVSGESRQRLFSFFSNPTPLSILTAALCFSLCFSWSACLCCKVSSRFPLLVVEHSRVKHIQNGWVCQAKPFSQCLSPSLILSVWLFCSAVTSGKGHFFTRSRIPLQLLSFYSRNQSAVIVAKNGCTADKTNLQLIATFATLGSIYGKGICFFSFFFVGFAISAPIILENHRSQIGLFSERVAFWANIQYCW